MAQKHSIFHGKFVKNDNGKLIPAGNSRVKYEEFLKTIEVNQTVDIFMEANKDDGTLAQLAKVHVCIRKIADETGEDFEKSKLDITKMSGLCFITTYDDQNVLFCKSLADCSKEELSQVINTIINVGDTLNINFR